jgi:hypothetical protein
VSIGTEHESSLHRALKFRYAGEGETEVSRGSYVCDGLSPAGELIEIQTGSFGPLKAKVPELVKSGRVRIIHPIITRKIIERYDPRGALLSRRASPRKGTIWDLFKVLIYAPDLPLIKDLVIELALVETAERRVGDGRGSWRRRGDSIVDRILIRYQGSVPLARPGDYRCFLPFREEESFTVKELGERAGIHTAIARKTLYVLTRMELVERTEKRGNSWVYRVRRPGKKPAGTKKTAGKDVKKEPPGISRTAPLSNPAVPYQASTISSASRSSSAKRSVTARRSSK